MPGRPINPANRLGLDYRAEADRFRRTSPPTLLGGKGLHGSIIDIHSHVNGANAGRLFKDVAALFGVKTVFTMVRLPEAATTRAAMGDMVRFIAFPNFRRDDIAHAFGEGYLADIEEFRHTYDARMMKLWNAPALRDRVPADRWPEVIEFDSPWRLRHIELAQRLGMMIMVHVADPDTWFGTKYKDAGKYGSKREAYRGLEAVLDRFAGPWLAAHMGGWPEDLRFLDALLTRHPNLHLDTSATRWVVRELSKHPRDEVVDFLRRFRGRILFGSDIVTLDEHLVPKQGPSAFVKADQASSPDEAFDLYASRYWSLRTMLETSYDGESPMADPDLAMVEPGVYDAMSAPRLRGLSLPGDILESLYVDAPRALMAKVGLTL